MASSRFHILASAVAAGVAVAVLNGCGTNKSSTDSSYPSGGSTGTSTYQSSAAAQPMTPPPPPVPVDESKRVPKGAIMVSSGPFPPPSFEVAEGGLLYVFDNDTNSVVLTTRVGNSQINRTINLAEMPNIANALNNKHSYRIFFVPSSAATTLSAPLGQ